MSLPPVRPRGGDTVEVVAWTSVLAPRSQLTPPPVFPNPLPPPTPPSHSTPPLPTRRLHPTLFRSSLCPVSSASHPQRPGNARSSPFDNVWYDRPDPPPSVRGGRRPRGVGIHCLVALEREAWRIEIGVSPDFALWVSHSVRTQTRQRIQTSPHLFRAEDLVSTSP